MPRAIVVGSGPGGSTAAMALAQGGWEVLLLEKGRNWFGTAQELLSQAPPTPFSNDELKEMRDILLPVIEYEPRTFRVPGDAEPRRLVGTVNHLPSLVGGGTVHWDAKTPRYWDIDFKKLSLLGPIAGADVVDWPFEYSTISPFYDEVEALIGVQGDVAAMQGTPTLAHAPRGPFPMPPGPGQYGSLRLADGARTLGFRPFPFQMAINSVDYDGRPPCNNCGFCSGWGCPIHARIGALAPLRRALLTGRVELRPDTFVARVSHDCVRADGVWIRDDLGNETFEPADFVVLAGSAIESNRLALLSGVPDLSGLLGRGLMFHWFTVAFAVFLGERLHSFRNRSTSHTLDDFNDPDFPGARQAAAAAGLPYFRGGVLEMGGSQSPIAEAKTYLSLLFALSPNKPFGRRFKELMRGSLLRDRLAGTQMIAEDLAQLTNQVDLDPDIRDYRGVPVARITYEPHAYELTAQRFYIPHLSAIGRAGGADLSAAQPQNSTDDQPSPVEGNVPSAKHIMGGMRMGVDPMRSVCDPYGRLWTLPNVGVADASVFPTSGGHNPTLTLMAVALRNARAWATLG